MKPIAEWRYGFDLCAASSPAKRERLLRHANLWPAERLEGFMVAYEIARRACSCSTCPVHSGLSSEIAPAN